MSIKNIARSIAVATGPAMAAAAAGQPELAAGLAGGAAGKAVGDSKITGDQEWDKLLGPVTAVLFPTIYKLLGGDMSYDDAARYGVTIGATAIGAYSAGKSLYNLFGKLFKKKAAGQ